MGLSEIWFIFSGIRHNSCYVKVHLIYGAALHPLYSFVSQGYKLTVKQKLNSLGDMNMDHLVFYHLELFLKVKKLWTVVGFRHEKMSEYGSTAHGNHSELKKLLNIINKFLRPKCENLFQIKYD